MHEAVKMHDDMTLFAVTLEYLYPSLNAYLLAMIRVRTCLVVI
jgi:hypothetical protein